MHVRTAALFLFLAACAAMPRSGPSHFADARGAWSDESGAMSIEPSRIVTREAGDVIVRGFIREEPNGVWVLRKWGRIERWNAAFDRDTLVIGARRLHRIAAAPDELRIEPMQIGRIAPLPEAHVKAIVDEIASRNEREQAAMRAEMANKNEQTSAAVHEVTADNLRWLTGVVKEIGWIDVGRFGMKPSSRATIILKHSGGHALPLVLAALPQIERDLANPERRAYQSYEIFFDALQLQLGARQRFGTQLAADANGNPFVLPLEDPEHVDERRAAIGDMPLREYLAMAAKVLYPGKTVSLTPPEE
jgi:hypothetical protein